MCGVGVGRLAQLLQGQGDFGGDGLEVILAGVEVVGSGL
jgi:hypothetical protein